MAPLRASLSPPRAGSPSAPRDRSDSAARRRVRSLIPGIRHALVVVIKAARHRRQPGFLERHERRRRQAEQFRRVGDDRLGRRRLVVADIIDRAGTWPAIEAASTLARSSTWMREKTCPGFRMRFAVPSRSAVERGAAGTVDRGEPEDMDRHAPAPPRSSHPPRPGRAASRARRSGAARKSRPPSRRRNRRTPGRRQ